MLAPAEPLLLGRGDEFAVDHERGGRVVIDRVDPENAHARAFSFERSRVGSRPLLVQRRAGSAG
jgi:hypothetical protein